jgi:hypothetical protein
MYSQNALFGERGKKPHLTTVKVAIALPHLTSAFSTVSHSIPRNGGWRDSAGSGLSFPTLLKQQEALSIAKKRQK